MPRDTRNPSAARIAITLGSVVAVVMLVIWGATFAADRIHTELRPTPQTASSLATRSVAATKVASLTPPVTAAAPTAAPKPAPKPAPPKPKPVAPKPAAPKAKYVVVVDAGHGGELSGTEALGPWAGAPQKAKTNSGAEGEAEIVLQVALKIRPMLEKQGVKVIMVRTAPRAISNKDRAMIANNAHADLFLRLHCDGQDGGSSVHGISMQVPGDSRGWAPIGPSRKAGELILSSLIRETGAVNKGIASRSGDSEGLVGFNWCKVPTALPEMGFVSNPTENAKLHSASYQAKLAKAIADGTMAYLRTVR